VRQVQLGAIRLEAQEVLAISLVGSGFLLLIPKFFCDLLAQKVEHRRFDLILKGLSRRPAFFFHRFEFCCYQFLSAVLFGTTLNLFVVVDTGQDSAAVSHCDRHINLHSLNV
jgi:hypothetical protein